MNAAQPKLPPAPPPAKPFAAFSQDDLAKDMRESAFLTRQIMNRIGAQDQQQNRAKRGQTSYDKIEAWARDYGKPFTANQACKAIGLGQKTGYPAITELTVRGTLRKIGDTVRTVPGSPARLVAEYMLSELIADVAPPQSGLKSAQRTPPASAHGRNAKPASGAKSGV